MVVTTLITADLHLSSNPKDRYRHDFVGKELLTLLRTHKPDRLLILGDLTDQKDQHRAELVNEIVDYLYELARRCPVIIMRGNHDCLNPDTPFFQFVGKIDNITWITHSQDYLADDIGYCLFLPHTRNHKKDWTKIDFSPFKRECEDVGWIFAHNTFDGADAGNGRRLRGIPTDIFPKKARVISGDVHVPQQLGQVAYVGAPYTMIFGDTYKPRMLMIGITPQGKSQIQSIPCRGPRKWVVEIQKPNLDLPTFEFNQGDMVQARVHLEASDYAKWNELKLKVQKQLEPYGISINEIRPIKASKTIRLDRERSGQHRTDQQLIRHYGKRRGISADLMKTGLWIMERA